LKDRESELAMHFLFMIPTFYNLWFYGEGAVCIFFLGYGRCTKLGWGGGEGGKDEGAYLCLKAHKLRNGEKNSQESNVCLHH